MKKVFNVFFPGLLLLCFTFTITSLFGDDSLIQCGKNGLPSHVQGIAVDDTGIYWSFTNVIVKTDFQGKEIKSVETPPHSGDMCIDDKGILNVSFSVRDKKLREEYGTNSVINRYDKELKLVETVKLANNLGPDGIAFLNGKYYVCADEFGYKPHPFNYIYVFDDKFKEIAKLKVELGKDTKYGVQTLSAYQGKLLAGFYCSAPSAYILDPETGKALEAFPRSVNVGFANVPETVAKEPGTFFINNLDGKKENWSAKIRIYKLVDGKLIPATIKSPVAK